ncbi:hypothetical protein RR46_14795 [Papilio xuthus]|uniref:Uncharacterized protein n=1 Tax=Papilio xuthus TaxID=66420 RepID=A0A194PD83_PAPXU|nr:hypothetical protein RR46_14795 [Papilio xuthus]
MGLAIVSDSAKCRCVVCFIRLSVPTSRSARRRAAVRARVEGENIAQQRRQQRRAEKFEQQRKALKELASYEPWGKPGGGAPNKHGFRFTDIRARGIYPDDEIKGIAGYEEWRRWSSPKRRPTRTARAPVRLREDPQLFFAEQLRRAVDNDIRYKQTADQKKRYKEILDTMVEERNKVIRDEMRHNLEYERKMHTMAGPWGKPGPGGVVWRNPRNIGLNFSKSMGWTNNEMFDKLKGEHNGYKRSSLTLPVVKRDDDLKDRGSDGQNKSSTIEKLPDISNQSSPNINIDAGKVCDSPLKESNGPYNGNKTHRKGKVKRLCNGRRDTKSIVDDIDNAANAIEKKPTPEGTIQRMTGGIELVPLLARGRRVGARTLPSSDVTRPPEQTCQWREILDVDYLKQLKQQMRAKSVLKEESRRDSAERVVRHHATWSSWWGRPGHGAPQRGRYARNNLAQLLYMPPLDKENLHKLC